YRLRRNRVLSGEVPVTGQGVSGPRRILAAHHVFAVTAENPVVVVDVVVDTGVPGVSVVGNRILELVVRCPGPAAGRALARHSRWNVRVWIKRNQFQTHRIQTRLRNDVARYAATLPGYK